MKHTAQKIGYAIISCAFAFAVSSCNCNQTTTSGSRTTDSTTTTTAGAATDTATANANSGANGNGVNGANNTVSEHSKMAKEGNGNKMPGMADEPTGPAILAVTSPAFAGNAVIPAKYTCEGEGATPPISVKNIPAGTQSLAMIVYDYNATPEGGFTYWLIWNVDTTDGIPENFRNNHEGMNAANQYGYTPICAKSGNHKYHFIVYALDCKLKMAKTTTKPMLENVMRGHVLGKGEVVGIYNKRLD